MGMTTNKEGQPIAYHRDRDEPVGSEAFKKIDPYDAKVEMVEAQAGEYLESQGMYGTFEGDMMGHLYGKKTTALVDPTVSCGVSPTSYRRYPGTLAELTTYAQKFFGNGIDVIREKNQRYAGTVDPFKNFRLGGTYGIAIRMSDKVSRLLTLLEPGTTIAATKDESIEDTCQDLANYCAILSAMRRNESGQ